MVQQLRRQQEPLNEERRNRLQEHGIHAENVFRHGSKALDSVALRQPDPPLCV
jgi:hypothetical protein